MHRTTALRRLAAAACTVALAAGLAGCSEGAEPTGGLAIVVGAHSNMPPPALAGTAADAREEALVSQAYLSIVVADGDPYEVEGAGILTARDDNGVIQQKDRDRNRTAIDSQLADARARTPETNLLAALGIAADNIRNREGQRTIVVVDSGLSTAGPLDFSHGDVLDAEPGKLADDLKGQRELPDLRGIRVVVQGLGDAVAPQVSLSNGQRAKLRDIWTAVLGAAGAKAELETVHLAGRPADDLPDVTPVPLSDGVACRVQRVVLDAGDVAFRAESAVFTDEAAATATLRPIADRILAENLEATLTGTTADVGDMAGQRELSLERANAVKGLLVALGVPVDRLATDGLGSEFDGFVPDRDGQGKLIAELAEANRKVEVELARAGVSCA